MLWLDRVTEGAGLSFGGPAFAVFMQRRSGKSLELRLHTAELHLFFTVVGKVHLSTFMTVQFCDICEK